MRGFAPSVGGMGIVALVRDDGRYANSPLKSWFDRLASRKGLCCSFADGFRVIGLCRRARVVCRNMASSKCMLFQPMKMAPSRHQSFILARTCRIVSKCDSGAPVRSAALTPVARSAPAHLIVPDDGQHAAMQDDGLFA
jgi:hypothetical protein